MLPQFARDDNCQKRLDCVRYKITRDYCGLATFNAVGEISGKQLSKEATLSAMPSITPNCAGPAPSDTKNAGCTQYAISVAVSLKNEVSPKE